MVWGGVDVGVVDIGGVVAMAITNLILFLLAGIGVVNGLLLAMYFLFSLKPKKWVNLLFGLLLLVLCVRIGKSLFHVFSDVPRIYRQLALSTFILVGPLLFLYLRAFLSKVKNPSKFDLAHLAIPSLFILTIGLRWPYEQYPDLWNHYFILMIYTVWVVYMIASFRYVFPVIKKFFRKQAEIGERWLLLIYTCVLVLCIAYVAAYYGFPYLSGPILFSVVLYLIMGFFINKRNRLVILQDEPIKYQNLRIGEEKADELLKRLSDLMQNQQIYINKKVKLGQIAQSIDSTPHEVSQLINNRLGISFNTGYR